MPRDFASFHEPYSSQSPVWSPTKRFPSVRRTRALLLAASLLLHLAAYVTARTVVLVFDDSGSMREENFTDRLTPALYATQNLIGLLAPTDRLEVVLMTNPLVSRTLLPSNDPQNAIDAVNYSATGRTPIESVETGIRVLKDLRRDEFPDDEDYWLVAFTDGEFSGYEDDPEAILAWISSGLDDLRSHFADRKLGVLFLGIGPKSQEFADVWRAAGATTFAASDSDASTVDGNAIVGAMYEIATLVTGRDPDADGSDRGLTSRSVAPRDGYAVIEVDTDLPLRRLVMFHQADAPSGLRAIGASSSFDDGGGPRPVAVAAPLTIASGDFHASITAITATNPNEVLGPGRYRIAVDAATPIEPSAIRFLPEVALGLELARDDRPATRCVADPIDLTAAIANSVTGLAVDLESIGGLEIYADVATPSGERRTFFTPTAGAAYAATLATELGANVVSVTARYPGYFVLRSEIFRIEGVACATDASLSVAPAALESAAVFGTDPAEVGRFEVRIAGLGDIAPDRPLILEAQGIPDGWSLVLGEWVLTADAATLTLDAWPAGGVVAGTAFAGPDAAPGRSTVTIVASTDFARVRFTTAAAPLALTLDPIEVALGPSTLPAVSATPTILDTPEVVASARLEVRPVDPTRTVPGGETFTVTLEGAPDGVFVDVGGVTLSRAAPTADVPFEELSSLTATLLRDRDFRASAATAIALTLATPDPRIRLTSARTVWPLGVQAVEVALEPARLEPVPLARTTVADPSPVAAFDLALTSVGAARPTGREQVALTAAGLPNGMAVAVAGGVLTNASPTLRTSVDALARAEVRLLRSAAYEGAANEEVRLTVESLDGVLTFTNDTLAIPLRFVPIAFARDPNPDTRCVGAPIDVSAAVAPIVGGVRLDPRTLRGLAVEAVVDAPGAPNARVPLTPRDEFGFAASIPTAAGPNRIAVSAGFPGGFVLASQDFSVEGVVCAGDVRVSAQPSAFETTAVFGADPVAVGTIAFALGGITGFTPTAPLTIEVAGLPAGWSLAFGDVVIAAPGGRITTPAWPVGDAVVGTLFASAEALPGEATFTLTAATTDERVAFAQPTAAASVRLRPVDVALSTAALPSVTVTPTAGVRPEQVATAPFGITTTPRLLGLADADTVTLTLDGVPPGVFVDVGGELLSRARPSAAIPLAALLSTQLTLLRDRDLPPDFAGDLNLVVSTTDRRLRITEPLASWPIGRATIDYTLEPARLPDVTVARTNLPTPSVVASAPLALTSVGSVRGAGAERFRVTAEGLPDGIALLLADARLTRGSPTAELTLAQLTGAEARVERSAAYADTTDATVRLTVESADGVIALRNRETTLTLRHEAREIGLPAERIEYPITRTSSPNPLTTGRPIALEVHSPTPLAEPTRVQVRALGLPAGVAFVVNGATLASDADVLEIDYRGDATLDVDVLRSRDFRAGRETLVTIAVSSDDPTLRWSRDRVVVALLAEPRAITIDPLDEPWATLQNAAAAPFAARVLADGEPLTGPELASWTVTVEGEPNPLARSRYRIDPDTGLVTVALRQNFLQRFFPGANPVGDRPFDLTVQAEPDEVAARALSIRVDAVGFWEAWGWPLLRVLAVLLVIALALAHIFKKRIPRRAGLMYVRVRRVGREEEREPPRKFSIDGASALSPFGPERARNRSAQGFDFLANSRVWEPMSLIAAPQRRRRDDDRGVRSPETLGNDSDFDVVTSSGERKTYRVVDDIRRATSRD